MRKELYTSAVIFMAVALTICSLSPLNSKSASYITPAREPDARPMVSLVRDINRGMGKEGSGNPLRLASAGNLAYFSARTADPLVQSYSDYYQLWRTDGTSQGTIQLSDFGDLQGPPIFLLLGSSGEKSFFCVDYYDQTGNRITSVYASDGTPGGTLKVADLPCSTFSIDGKQPTVILNGSVYGVYYDYSSAHLWKTDGTPSGSGVIKEVAASDGYLSPHVSNLVVYQGNLYFLITTLSTSGEEVAHLWKSDGTPDGTVVVKSLGPHYFSTLGVLWNGIYFLLDNGSLWQSDGTAAGTAIFYNNPDFHAGSYYGFQTGDLFYFAYHANASGNTYLYKTDGTKTGTRKVLSIPFDNENYQDNICSYIGSINERDFFYSKVTGLFTTDGTSAGILYLPDIPMVAGSPLNGKLMLTDGGSRLWSSDGTPAGTSLVVQLSTSSPLYYQGIATLGNKVVFGAATDELGRELWQSDGTAEGTGPLANIALAEPLNSNPQSMLAVGGTAYFTAFTESNGRELWKSDGTESGTQMVKDINPGPEPSTIMNMIAFQGQLFFTTRDPDHGVELWKSDGTESGTALVKDINPGSGGSSEPSTLMEYKGSLYFTAYDDIHLRQVWKSDGTPEGTQIAITAPDGSTITNIIIRDDYLYIIGSSPLKIWQTNGTQDNIVLIGQIESSIVWDVARVGDYFVVSAGHATSCGRFCVTGYSDLWAINRTTAEVKMLASLTAPYAPYGFNLVSKHGFAFWLSVGLWRTDGTEAGTYSLANKAGFCSNQCKVLLDGGLYFQGYSDSHGYEPWKSDGTPAGTMEVMDINPNAGSSNPKGFSLFNGKMIFNAYTAERGNNLWASDGTQAGTRLVTDIYPTGDPDPSQRTPVQLFGSSLLLLSSADLLNGHELWLTGGASETTRFIQDINPGKKGSYPSGFVDIGRYILFTAFRDDVGRELFAFDKQAYAWPLLYDTAFFTPLDTPLQANLPGLDPQSKAITFSLVTTPTLGTVLLNNPATGAFTYTPNPGASGADHFTFKVSNGTFESWPATVWIAIYQDRFFLPLLQK